MESSKTVPYTAVKGDDSTSPSTAESSRDPSVTQWHLDMRTSDKEGAIIMCTVMGVVLIVGVFGNTLTLVAIRTTPRLWTKSNTLIAGLAAIDLIICGPFGAITIAYLLIVYISSNDPCKYLTLVGVVFPIVLKLPYFAGTVTLIGIAADRYVAIVHSLRYDVLVTPGKIRLILGLSWVYAVLMGSIFAFWLLKVDWSSCDYPYSPMMNVVVDVTEHSIVSTTMFVLYTRIFVIAIRQQRRIEAESVGVRSFQAPAAEDAVRIEAEKKTRKRWRKELRAARMTAALVAAYVLLAVPYFVARGIESTGNLTNSKIVDVTSSIAALNISLDWLLYAIVSKEYRRAYRRLLTCQRRSLAVTNGNTS